MLQMSHMGKINPSKHEGPDRACISLDHILQLRKDIRAVLCSIDNIANSDFSAIHQTVLLSRRPLRRWQLCLE